VLSDYGITAEEGICYKVHNTILQTATERIEIIESGATVVSNMSV